LSVIKKSGCQLIGVLAKLHGYKGEYLLISDLYLSEEITKWESVFIETDGLLVPFFIHSFSITSDDSAIIGFEDVNNPEQAKEFLSCSVFQLKTYTTDLEDKLDPNLLAGYKIVDQQAGLIGEIDQILNYNNNLLFRILKDKREILIPATESIIIKINHKKREVIIAAPQGLLDL